MGLLLSIGACFGTRTLPAQSRPTSADARPNIVFVLLDDVRYDDLIDHPFVALPHLRRLITEGASFRQAFTSAPLCSPSRAVFLTGRYPLRNGIIDNAERREQSHQLVTFPRLLRDQGYRTGFFGKWHMSHDDDTPRPGFDRWVSFTGQGVYFNPSLNIDGRLEQASGYTTDLLTDHAVRFIRSAPATQPFLVFLAQKASHPEIHPNQVRTFPPAPGDESLYTTDRIPHGPAWRAPVDGKPALQRPYDHSDPRSPEGGLPESVIRDRLRMLASVDRGIGRLRAELEARGQLDRTVFVITSDQGFFYGEFGLAQERRLAYDPSIHIPLIVRYPRLVPRGSRPMALASNVDIAPTLLELAGAAVPAGLDGRSLRPALRDPAAQGRDALLIEYYADTEFPRTRGMGYHAVRTARWKFIRYRELVGMDELYDLSTDPHELHNLLPDRAPPGVVAMLTRRLEALVAPPVVPTPMSPRTRPSPASSTRSVRDPALHPLD